MLADIQELMKSLQRRAGDFGTDLPTDYCQVALKREFSSIYRTEH